MVKRERRGGRQAIDDWHRRAIELDALLKDARRGERDGVYRDFAEHLGTSVSVPRRMIQALRFIEYVRDDVGFAHLAERIGEQPLTSLVVLDRWSQYAPDRALGAAQRLVNGEINLPMLRELERSDRATREAVLSSAAGTWQTFAATQARRQVEQEDPGARCFWFARGWRPDGMRQESLRLPGTLNELPSLPSVHLVFARSHKATPLLVSILSDRVARNRSRAIIVQLVLTLLGYTRLSCDCLLLVRVPEEAAAVEELIAQLGHPEGLTVMTLEFD